MNPNPQARPQPNPGPRLATGNQTAEGLNPQEERPMPWYLMEANHGARQEHQSQEYVHFQAPLDPAARKQAWKDWAQGNGMTDPVGELPLPVELPQEARKALRLPLPTVDPETERHIRQGIQDSAAGRTRPWSQVKRELGIP